MLKVPLLIFGIGMIIGGIISHFESRGRKNNYTRKDER